MTFEQRAARIAAQLNEEGQTRPDMQLRLVGAGVIWALLAIAAAVASRSES